MLGVAGSVVLQVSMAVLEPVTSRQLDLPAKKRGLA
jgi:hypothetical protein